MGFCFYGLKVSGSSFLLPGFWFCVYQGFHLLRRKFVGFGELGFLFFFFLAKKIMNLSIGFCFWTKFLWSCCFLFTLLIYGRAVREDGMRTVTSA